MFNIPYSTDNVSIFTLNGTTAGRYRTWVKPQGCSMIYILCIGGGSGGGGGFSGVSGTTRGGGGSGGAGGITSLLIPAHLVPNALYVEIGEGGNGGAAGANGVNSTASAVSYSRSYSTAANNLLVRSGNGGATGGSAGTGAAGGAAGNGAAAATTTICSNIRFGNYTFTAGGNGIIGGAPAVAGGNITSKSSILIGGASGAGVGADDVSKDGGSIILTNTVIHPTIAGGTAGAHGENGISMFNAPMYFLGGAGGSSNGTGVGGDGGNGGYGCGGGGGGGGTTGGRGGNGGSGLVLIAWY